MLSIIPAYGRDYKSKKATIEAWRAGQDFQISDMSHPDDGRYVNAEQIPKGEQVKVRYKSLRQVATFTN